MGYRMGSELVAQLWLAGVAGLNAGMVGTTLPRDNTAWAASGFVQVVGVRGGTPQPVVQTRSPVVQVDLWGTNLSSGKPPWWRTEQLGVLVVDGCEADDQQRQVSKSGYDPVLVKNVAVVREPSRVPSDEGAYAHYTMDLQITWMHRD